MPYSWDAFVQYACHVHSSKTVFGVSFRTIETVSFKGFLVSLKSYLKGVFVQNTTQYHGYLQTM